MKLQEIAQRLGCELRGDGQIDIHGVAPIEDAGPGTLSFVANPRYRPFLSTTRAAAIIVAPTAARSMVVLAPISTSSSITTVPPCTILRARPSAPRT